MTTNARPPGLPDRVFFVPVNLHTDVNSFEFDEAERGWAWSPDEQHISNPEYRFVPRNGEGSDVWIEAAKAASGLYMVIAGLSIGMNIGLAILLSMELSK